ncbi:O-antigen ligase [Bosea sp. LC85]|uniref:O-antigen ligase family protein n=1 Tax=Bosea sp. LC85 TaxID=1502851 RepID=UPI0005BCCADD|nr:O-antigen ligase family protein [Bosea sp. LC85]
MLLDLLLALGLLLSTASQLRPTGLPVGPGELFLVTWVFLMLGREAARLGPPMTRPLAVLLIFWAVFAVAQSSGTMAGYVIGDVHDRDLFLHSVKAYVLLAIVSCLIVVGPDAGAHLHRMAWLVVSLGAGFLVLQIASGFGVIGISGVDPWYWERFRGWSSNANQLALLCVVLALLSLHLAELAPRAGGKVAALACGIVPVYVGRLSMSDSFALVLAFSVPVYLALKLRSWTRPGRSTVRSAFAWIVILAIPAGVIAAAPLVNAIAEEAVDTARFVARGNEADTERSASIRFGIWAAAIDRGLESAMLGLGPGPHLKNPFQIDMGPLSEEAQENPNNPKQSHLPNFEAHNTLLDLFTQSGLIGLLSVAGLGAVVLAGTWNARLDGLTILMIGLAVFSSFHFIVRHPIVWFAIAMCLVAGSTARQSSPRIES